MGFCGAALYFSPVRITQECYSMLGEKAFLSDKIGSRALAKIKCLGWLKGATVDKYQCSL